MSGKERQSSQTLLWYLHEVKTSLLWAHSRFPFAVGKRQRFYRHPDVFTEHHDSENNCVTAMALPPSVTWLQSAEFSEICLTYRASAWMKTWLEQNYCKTQQSVSRVFVHVLNLRQILIRIEMQDHEVRERLHSSQTFPDTTVSHLLQTRE